MKKTKGTTYKCSKCNTEEFIPENEFGLKTSQIIKVLCPICLNKNHKYQMKPII